MQRLNDVASADAWLSGKPQQVVQTFALRCALRTIGCLSYSQPRSAPAFSLACLRLLILTSAASSNPEEELREAVQAAMKSLGTVAASFRGIGGGLPATTCSDAAMWAASAVTASGPITYAAANAMTSGGLAALHAAMAMGADSEGWNAARETGFEVATEDAAWMSLAGPQHTLLRPLWGNVEAPDALSRGWAELREEWSSPEWDFWRRWYEGFLDGAPLPSELQREVALLADEDWRKGPNRVYERIQQIELRRKLEARIAELEQELKASTSSRLGIGGNYPPEPLEDASHMAQELVIVWEPLDVLKQEVRQSSPDRRRVLEALKALGAALKLGVEYAASKADLAVNTAIKWGVPAVGGYFVLHPDKIQAVMDAAQAWYRSLFG